MTLFNTLNKSYTEVGILVCLWFSDENKMQIGNPVISSQNDMSHNYNISAHSHKTITLITSILIIINIFFTLILHITI